MRPTFEKIVEEALAASSPRERARMIAVLIAAIAGRDIERARAEAYRDALALVATRDRDVA